MNYVSGFYRVTLDDGRVLDYELRANQVESWRKRAMRRDADPQLGAKIVSISYSRVARA